MSALRSCITAILLRLTNHHCRDEKPRPWNTDPTFLEVCNRAAERRTRAARLKMLREDIEEQADAVSARLEKTKKQTDEIIRSRRVPFFMSFILGGMESDVSKLRALLGAMEQHNTALRAILQEMQADADVFRDAKLAAIFREATASLDVTATYIDEAGVLATCGRPETRTQAAQRVDDQLRDLGERVNSLRANLAPLLQDAGPKPPDASPANPQ